MSLLARRVERTQRGDAPTEVVVTIKGRTILFESEEMSRILLPNRVVFRTTMVVDERRPDRCSYEDFLVYQASMSVALLQSLPPEEK